MRAKPSVIWLKKGRQWTWSNATSACRFRAAARELNLLYMSLKAEISFFALATAACSACLLSPIPNPARVKKGVCKQKRWPWCQVGTGHRATWRDCIHYCWASLLIVQVGHHPSSVAQGRAVPGITGGFDDTREGTVGRAGARPPRPRAQWHKSIMTPDGWSRSTRLTGRALHNLPPCASLHSGLLSDLRDSCRDSDSKSSCKLDPFRLIKTPVCIFSFVSFVLLRNRLKRRVCKWILLSVLHATLISAFSGRFEKLVD